MWPTDYIKSMKHLVVIGNKYNDLVDTATAVTLMTLYFNGKLTFASFHWNMHELIVSKLIVVQMVSDVLYNSVTDLHI